MTVHIYAIIIFEDYKGEEQPHVHEDETKQATLVIHPRHCGACRKKEKCMVFGGGVILLYPAN